MKEDELLKDLNTEQKEAVTSGDGPLLIVAGAGTGKTTVITKRLAWLALSGKAKTEEILALTFTDKAAGEMEERVDRLLPYGYLDLWISTFHAFAERILKDNGLAIGLPNDFRLLNETEQWLLVRQNLDKFKLDYYRPLGNPTKFIHALLKHFSRAKDEAITPAEYLAYVEELKLNTDSAEFIKGLVDEETMKDLSKKDLKEIATEEIKKLSEVAEAYHVYQQLLLDNSALDFGDLINYCLKLFRERPLILNKYRRQFKYILVDEFQDTNWAQNELIKMLASPRNNLTVVGDDDQSVYKFRGASVSNILEFKGDFPGTKEVFLNQNYRSTQDILDLSYRFIKQNDPNRLEAKLGKDKNFSKKLIGNNQSNGLIRHFHLETAEDEIKAVLKQIIDLKSKDKEATWNDFAILVRANNTANPFIYGFSQTNIPYQFIASRGLYSKPIIMDIMAYLKLLDNYHEGPAMYRIISLPIFGFTHHEIIDLNNIAGKKKWSLYETLGQAAALKFKPETVEKAKKILALLDRHSQKVREGTGVTEMIFSFLEDTGYLKELTKSESAATTENARLLNQFYKKIADFENSFSDKSVKNFLNLLELETEAGEEGALNMNPDEGPESVKIMSIHAAKGLEFKYVFIPSLVDRRFPTSEKHDPIELPDKLVKEIVPKGDIHLEEERRLFYVAMTRAKEGLFFSSAEDYGGARKKKLSRFLIELGGLGFRTSEAVKISEPIKREKKTEEKGKKTDWKSVLPKEFSFTQLKAFENCPYQYRFAHVLHIPVRGKGPMSFGKTIHSTLQQFFAKVIERAGGKQADIFGEDKTKNKRLVQKDIASEEELLEIYENSWIDDWYLTQADQKKYKANGQKLLKDFYQNLPAEYIPPKYLEEFFHLKITDAGETYTIRGAIDRIDEAGGGVEIIDYKTGKGKEKLKTEEKDQLYIYQLAANEVLKEKVVKLTYYYLEDNSKISFIGEEKDLEKVKGKITETIREIKKGEFLPQPSMLCEYCDFKNICEYRQL